jgi:hypothetical protein
VENLSGYVRDVETNVVINTNKAEIEAARKRKQLMRQQKEQQLVLADEVEDLKSEIKEIKDLLVQLVNGNNNS